MDSTTEKQEEKYAVCPARNTPAAFRWFHEPLSVLAFLKGRRTPPPIAAALRPVPSVLVRTRDR